MNERIKTLAKVAGYDEINKAAMKLIGFDPEKFALLIVRECVGIVDEQKECLHEEQQYWHDRDYGYEMAVNDTSNGIKQFFGVEE